MGRETDQVGSSGEGPIGKVAAARSRIGGMRFGNKNILRKIPGKIRSIFTSHSSEMSGYVFDTTKLKQVQSESCINTMKDIKTYIGSNYSGGDSLCKCLDKLSIIDIPKPTRPALPADKFETDIYKHEIKTYAKQRYHTR